MLQTFQECFRVVNTLATCFRTYGNVSNYLVKRRLKSETLIMLSIIFLGSVFAQVLPGNWPPINQVPVKNDEWTKLISEQSALAPSFPEYLTCVSEYDWAFTYGFIKSKYR
jgi:hypothetical protein